MLGLGPLSGSAISDHGATGGGGGGGGSTLFKPLAHPPIIENAPEDPASWQRRINLASFPGLNIIHVAQTANEVIAANANPPVHVASTFIEVIASTTVIPPNNVIKPPAFVRIEAAPDDIIPFLANKPRRIAPSPPPPPAVPKPRLSQMPGDFLEERTSWMTHNYKAFAAVPRSTVSMWVNT